MVVGFDLNTLDLTNQGLPAITSPPRRVGGTVRSGFTFESLPRRVAWASAPSPTARITL